MGRDNPFLGGCQCPKQRSQRSRSPSLKAREYHTKVPRRTVRNRLSRRNLLERRRVLPALQKQERQRTQEPQKLPPLQQIVLSHNPVPP